MLRQQVNQDALLASRSAQTSASSLLACLRLRSIGISSPNFCMCGEFV